MSITQRAPVPEEVGELASKAAEFQDRLNRLKTEIGAVGFDWYPYDSIGALYRFSQLLKGDWRFTGDILGTGPILDICCGDGALAFFIESMGFEVHAVDWAPANFNAMRGAHWLKQALSSSVEIHDIDLDRAFSLPGQRYSAAFFFAGLYHLRNPFHTLENLSRRAAFCFLTTRVARFAADKVTKLHNLPVASLLSEGESNDGSINYWIFSEAGLRVLLDRTNWDICSYMSDGNTVDSDPLTPEGDERAWCLLKSRIAAREFAFPGQTRLIMTDGWHEVEDGRWRWTERKFAVYVRNPAPEARSIVLSFAFPKKALEKVGPITLSCRCNGVALPPRTYSRAGNHLYRASLPAAVHPSGHAEIEFELDRALPPDAVDERERGVIVHCGRIGEILR
jgi:tRNA (mo5U34)-methyltransferase